MIRPLCLLLLLTIGTLNGYSQKTAEDYFSDGVEAERIQNDSAAIKNFTFIIANHPSSLLCPYAYYYLGCAYARQGVNVAAIKAFRTAMAAKDIKNGQQFGSVKLYNYKHAAVFILCDIYDRMRQYDSALYFLGLYDSVFLRNCCYDDAIGAEEDRKWTTVRYAEVYQDANRIRDAEHALLSRHAFKAYEYRYEDKIEKKLDELFRKFEQPETLKSEIEIAVNNYFFDTVSYDLGKARDTAIHICINFLGAKVWYSYSGGFFRERSSFDNGGRPEPWEKEKIIAALKKSGLYTMIQKM